MRAVTILMMAALPLAAAGWDDDHRWKLDEKETIRRTFDATSGSGGKKLLVDNIHGFIHVTGYNGSQVQVSIEKHIYADSNEAMAEAKRDVKMDMSQQGNFVRLYEDGPFRNGNGTNYRGDDYYGYRVVFDFDVQVPYDTELVLKGRQSRRHPGEEDDGRLRDPRAERRHRDGGRGGIGPGQHAQRQGKSHLQQEPGAGHSVQDAQRIGGCLFPERA